MIRDVRFALRALRKNPGFSLLAMCVLGAGIGAATAIFSVADGLLFRPLLLPDLDRLVAIGGVEPGQDALRRLRAVTSEEFLTWRESSRTLQHVTANDYQYAVNLSGDGEPERARRVRVTSSFFRALGAQPLLGRGFAAGDDAPGANPVVVLGEGLWRRRFAGRADTIGKTLRIDGEPFQIVGVMPAHVRVPAPAELWVPLAIRDRNSGVFGYQTLARIAPGFTLEQANSELAAFSKSMAAKYPDTHGRLKTEARPIVEEISGYSAPYTRLMIGATLFLVLLACVNVANLQFVRVSARAKELAVQVALGAGRGHLIRRLLVESALVGVFGSAVGVFAGYWGVEAIRGALPAEVEIYLPGWRRMGIDWRALAYALTLGVGSGVIAGLAAAFSGSILEPMAVLKDGSRGASGTASRRRLRNAFVALEAALAVVLLAGAGLMVRGFRNIALPSPNLEPQRLLTFQMDLARNAYPDDAARRRFATKLIEKVHALPGVGEAAIASGLPYSGSWNTYAFQIQSRARPRDVWEQQAQAERVTPGFFRTLRIPIRRGRGLEARDDENAARVAVVNEAFVRRYFKGEEPLGQQIRPGFDPNPADPWYTVVGVAADIRQFSSEREVQPAFYRTLAQAPRSSFFVAMRASGDPVALGPAVRDAVRSLDASQAVFGMKSYEQMIEEELAGFWYVATLMGLFGALALVLAAVGLYSVLAYSVAERTREIGIRMALGATRERVLGSVMKQGLGLVTAGLAVGLAGAILLGRLMASLVFGVSGNDPATISGAVALLLVAALAACYFPARRAAGADPIEALRHD